MKSFHIFSKTLDVYHMICKFISNRKGKGTSYAKRNLLKRCQGSRFELSVYKVALTSENQVFTIGRNVGWIMKPRHTENVHSMGGDSYKSHFMINGGCVDNGDSWLHSVDAKDLNPDVGLLMLS